MQWAMDNLIFKIFIGVYLLYNVLLVSDVQWSELVYIYIYGSFPGGASVKEPACQYMRHKRWGFDLWVGKISWRRAWQPFLVFLPG